MKSLKLNTTKDQAWDIIISEGDVVLISDADYIPQKIKQLLLFVRGEFFRNTTLGMPWFDTILGQKNPDVATITTIITDTITKNKILKKLGVTSAVVTNVAIDGSNRTMSMSLEVKANGQTTVTELVI